MDVFLLLWNETLNIENVGVCLNHVYTTERESGRERDIKKGRGI